MFVCISKFDLFCALKAFWEMLWDKSLISFTRLLTKLVSLILKLIEFVSENVLKKTGIKLETEIKILE